MASGLAQTAVHNPDPGALSFKSLFDSVEANYSSADDLSRAVDSLRLNGSDSAATYPNVHALSILARILDDVDLVPTGQKDQMLIFNDTATKKGTKILEHVGSQGMCFRVFLSFLLSLFYDFVFLLF